MNIFVKTIGVICLALMIAGCVHSHVDEEEIMDEHTPDTEMGMSYSLEP